MDFLEAGRLHQSTMPWWRYFWLWHLMLAVGFLGLLVSGPTRWFLWVGFIYSLWIVLIPIIIIPIQTRRAFRAWASLLGPTTITVYRNSIVTRDRISISVQRWLYRVRHTDQIILLYINQKSFFILPRRFLASDDQFPIGLALLENIPQGLAAALPYRERRNISSSK